MRAVAAKRARERTRRPNYRDFRSPIPALRVRPASVAEFPPIVSENMGMSGSLQNQVYPFRYKNELSSSWG